MKMKSRTLTVLSLAMAALLLIAAAPASWADDEEDDGPAIPFADAEVFFELNNTDGDLGIHALIDGEPWRTLVIETPDESEVFQLRVRGHLRRQGLTELFFESAEPTFDELSPRRFFNRFPEGEYEIEGTTIDGEEMESVATVTHLLPAPPEIEVNGVALPEDCDEGPVPSLSEPFTVSWEPITESHPELGRTGRPIEVEQYELVVEREEPHLKFGIELPPDVTEVVLPAGLAESGDEFKVEVLVREESGNQTATESCFEVE